MEKPYIISYDLHEPGQRYASLKAALENNLKASWWTHYLESTYLVRTSLSAQEIVETLKPFLDKDDRMYIFEIKDSNYQGWLNEKEWKSVKTKILGLEG
ncbi:hypothetical protein [Lacticaseibacillus porcinae]|jgi:hypothetical protein|uniref:hypothetical protein n=1 Tax=Lacticaseibacillus porcinae TaxID=1123687 RepID=UPI000F7989DD|nr:hypothetical protein [Lacticaseibacillus porcinae]